VLDWNATAMAALKPAERLVQARAGVLTDLAVFNALNAIDHRFKFYGAALEPAPDASPEAAIAAANWQVLSAQPGIALGPLTEAYRAALDKLPASPAKTRGLALGQRAALALLAARADDDLTRIEPKLREPAAGVFELAGGPKKVAPISLARQRPFAIADIAAFDPGPPPPPGSAQDLRDLAEVAALGGRDSTRRSADQTAAALFWNSGEDGDINELFKAFVDAHKLSLVESARLQALSSLAVFDSGVVQVAFKDKYQHWRPYNAIRGRFADPSVRSDTWEPLARNNPNPDYPSGGGIGAGLTERLFLLADPGGSVPLVWLNTSTGQTRQWPSPQALATEFQMARVWAGLHFRTAVETGASIGRAVFDKVAATQLTPVR
jgi:hypothetical protein